MFKKHTLIFICINLILLIPLTLYTAYKDIQVNYYYQESSCTVLASNVRHRVSNFMPFIQVTYTFNNQSYTKWIPASRIHSLLKSEQEAITILNQFQLNSTFKCWVDPTRPTIVVVEKNYNTKIYYVTITWLLLLGFLAFNTRLYENKTGYSPAIKTSHDGLFEIKEHRFTIEYVYHGQQPVTIETLPKVFQRNYGTKQILVNKINEKGRLITLKKPYAYLLGVVIIIMLYFLYRP